MINRVDIGDFRELSRELRKFPLPFKHQYEYSLLRHFGNIENIRQATFLDLGSGIGNRLQDFVSSYGAHVINIDLDPRVIDELKSTGVEARLGSVYEIPFETGKADGVLCSEVIDIVPKSAGELKQLFTEAHRILKPRGLFLQRHNGGGLPLNFPKAKGQLELLSQTGFNHIRLLERPDTESELNFSAISTLSPQKLDDVLENNYNWVYRKTHTNHEGNFWDWERNNKKMDQWDKETIRKNLKDALTYSKSLLLLDTIRSIIIQFWPKDRTEDTLLDIATDFDFQFDRIRRYPEWFDEEYCLKNGLDPTIARKFYEKCGLRTVIDSWKEGKQSEFSFFGRSSHEKLVFDPIKKVIAYSSNSQDPEEAALQIRFDNTFGSNGLELS